MSWRSPLEDIVLAAFTDERMCHDLTTIACHLAGGIPPAGAAGAYRRVAADVLHSLSSHGKVICGDDGWYRLPGAKRPEDIEHGA